MAFKIVSITAVAVLMAMYVSKGVSNNQNSATIRSLDNQKNTLSQQLEVYQVEEARNSNAESTKTQAEAQGLTQTTKEVQINR
jgi:cytochrome c-type biogenesis protein CcmH/NrfG